MLVLVGAALWALRGQFPSIVAVARTIQPRWSLVGLASAIVLLTYALLIETWRRVLADLGGHLTYGEAAVIWLGSNLARYLPGAFWQMGAMGAMAQRRGIPLAVSTAGSLVVTIINVCTGLAVFIGGLALVAIAPADMPTISTVKLALLLLAMAALVALPWLTPRLTRLATRLTGREILIPRFSWRALIMAGLGTTVSWIAYGVAFWILTRAVLPADIPRSLVGCITLYTSAYLVGLFNPMPAGIGASEPVIVLLAPRLGVATTAEATVLALVVRAWRTVLEMSPSLIAIAIASSSRDKTAAQASSTDEGP